MSALLIALLLFDAGIETKDRFQLNRSSQPTTQVNYCELTSHPERYKGKIVRVEVSFLFGKHENVLYDLSCLGKQVTPSFECDKKTICDAMIDNLFKRSKGYDLYYRRVGASVIGRFEIVSSSNNQLKANKGEAYHLKIQKIEKPIDIPVKSPWPWDKLRRVGTSRRL
jgi:hypothetical protein